MVAPLCLFLLVFTIYPGIRGLLLAFTDGWIGEFKPSLASWGRVFGPNFWKSLKASVTFSVLLFPFAAIAVAIAVTMQHLPKRFCTGVQTALYMPTLAAGVAMSLVWKSLFHPSKGLLNLIIGKEILWLADPAVSPISITIVQGIPSIGPAVYMLVAFVSQIPLSLYEQARLDGCGAFRATFRITLPILGPVLLYTLCNSTLIGFNLFASIAILTDGGPSHATSSMAWLIYETAFMGSDLPRAAGIGIVQNIITLPVMLLLYRSVWREI